jgi:hypothetical protein
MTPKNQAAKLRYLISIELGLQTQHEKVIMCALIAVDTILDAHLFDLDEKEYWKQVKKILENKL